MQEPKTKKTRASVKAFLESNTGGTYTSECFAALDLMQKATGAKPAMGWGCLYVKSLKDVDIKVLKKPVAESIRHTKTVHTTVTF